MIIIGKKLRYSYLLWRVILIPLYRILALFCAVKISFCTISTSYTNPLGLKNNLNPKCDVFLSHLPSKFLFSSSWSFKTKNRHFWIHPDPSSWHNTHHEIFLSQPTELLALTPHNQCSHRTFVPILPTPSPIGGAMKRVSAMVDCCVFGPFAIRQLLNWIAI